MTSTIRRPCERRYRRAMVLLVPTSEGFDWPQLFLLAYLLHNHLSVAFVDSVSPCLTLRTDDFVKPAVYELDRAVVLNRDSDATEFLNHLPEVPSARDSLGPAVVVGAMDSAYKP